MIVSLGIVTTCGALNFALSTGLISALLGGSLLGLGTASVLMGSLKIFTHWFSEQEFPKVAGFMVAAGNLGGIAATAPLTYAISIFNWRPTFLAVAFLQAVVTIAVCLLVRDNPKDNSKMSLQQHVLSEDVDSSVFAVWKGLFSSTDFWMTALLAFFWYANYMVLLSLWGGPYLREVTGLTPSQSGTTLLCTSIGYICGSMLLGKVVNWFGGSLEKTIFAGQTILLLIMTAILGPADCASRLVLATIFFMVGLASASGVIIFPLAKRLAPSRHAATAMTGVNFFLLLGAAVMQHIMGYYIQSLHSGSLGHSPAAYHRAFLIPICGLAITLVMFVCRRGSSGCERVMR